MLTMKSFLAPSLVLILLASLFLVTQEQKASAVPVLYNQTAMSISWSTVARSGTTYDMFVTTGTNSTITSWYHGTTGSTTLSLQLGTGSTPYTLTCTPVTNHVVQANGSKIYYGCSVDVTHVKLENIDTLTGTKTHEFTASASPCTGIQEQKILLTMKQATFWLFSNTGSTCTIETTKANGNVTQAGQS